MSADAAPAPFAAEGALPRVATRSRDFMGCRTGWRKAVVRRAGRNPAISERQGRISTGMRCRTMAQTSSRSSLLSAMQPLVQSRVW